MKTLNEIAISTRESIKVLAKRHKEIESQMEEQRKAGKFPDYSLIDRSKRLEIMIADMIISLKTLEEYREVETGE